MALNREFPYSVPLDVLIHYVLTVQYIPGKTHCILLSENIREWLIDNMIVENEHFAYLYIPSSTRGPRVVSLLFFDETDAMAFKLRWL